MRRALPFLLGLLGLLLAGSGAAAAPRASSCTDACYQAKSIDYQRCRTVPATDRAARRACFERADRALQRCLRGCRAGAS